MPVSLELLLLFLGLGMISAGAELLLRGSANIAQRLGTRPLVIGLTVVAYGNAAPELAVSTDAALSGATPLALGTIIGSCIVNLSLVLGITALIRPITIDARLISRELPVLVGSVLLVPVLLLDGTISRVDGAILVGCAVAFTILTLSLAARHDGALGERRILEQAQDAAQSYTSKARSHAPWPAALLLWLGAIGLLFIGSGMFLDAAQNLGHRMNASDRVLGLTVVALGTALPELLAGIFSAWRGDGAVAIGSIIGSNLLNVFLVLGVVAWMRPIPLGVRSNVFDLIGLVVITLLAAFFVRSGRQIERREGAILLLAYLGFATATALV